MFETARPGVMQRTVWVAMFSAMVNASGERPFRVSIRADAEGNSALNRPLEEVMRAGQVLSQECSACVLGYGSQVNHSVVIGSPAPADWDAAAKDSLDTFHEMVALIAPGKMVKDVCAPLDKRLVARGERAGALVIHSGGLGTLPRGGSAGAVGEMVLQAGMVFRCEADFCHEERRHGSIRRFRARYRDGSAAAGQARDESSQAELTARAGRKLRARIMAGYAELQRGYCVRAEPRSVARSLCARSGRVREPAEWIRWPEPPEDHPAARLQTRRVDQTRI